MPVRTAPAVVTGFDPGRCRRSARRRDPARGQGPELAAGSGWRSPGSTPGDAGDPHVGRPGREARHRCRSARSRAWSPGRAPGGGGGPHAGGPGREARHRCRSACGSTSRRLPAPRTRWTGCRLRAWPRDASTWLAAPAPVGRGAHAAVSSPRPTRQRSARASRVCGNCAPRRRSSAATLDGRAWCSPADGKHALEGPKLDVQVGI